MSVSFFLSWRLRCGVSEEGLALRERFLFFLPSVLAAATTFRRLAKGTIAAELASYKGDRRQPTRANESKHQSNKKGRQTEKKKRKMMKKKKKKKRKKKRKKQKKKKNKKKKKQKKQNKKT